MLSVPKISTLIEVSTMKLRVAIFIALLASAVPRR